MRFWLRQLLAAIRLVTLRVAQGVLGQATDDEVADAQADLDEVSAGINTLADLAGRRQVRAAERRTLAGREPTRRPKPQLPNVPLRDAIDDLVARGVFDADTMAEVAAIYRDPASPGFALTRAPNETVTARVKDLVEQALVDGIPDEIVVELITDEAEEFDKAYARTVLRTNTNTAINRGKFQQAREMSESFPAMEYQTAGDVDVRDGDGPTPRGASKPENHAALDGFMAATNWSGWVDILPPNGYNCRCDVRLISRAELRALGLIDTHGNLDRSLTSPHIPRNFVKHPNF